MSKYSIKDLENLSGIKAHTIRIWEQRYGIINPKRTKTNIRFYDSEDLKLVLNIARLKDNGHKISKIANMSKEEMHQLVMEISGEEPQDYQNYLHNLTTSMIDLDEPLFEHTLSTSILQLGFEASMQHVIYPFLIRIGFLWQAEAIHPAQEHFITCLIRQKLIVAVDGQKYYSGPGVRKFMLYLPEQEMHEINLLFAQYLLKKYGNHVIYLGQNLPFKDLKMAYELHKPDYILTSITSSPKRKLLSAYIDQLAQTFKKCKVLIGGSALINTQLREYPNLTHLKSINDLLEISQLSPDQRIQA